MAELFEVKDNWYHFKNRLLFNFLLTLGKLSHVSVMKAQIKKPLKLDLLLTQIPTQRNKKNWRLRKFPFMLWVKDVPGYKHMLAAVNLKLKVAISQLRRLESKNLRNPCWCKSRPKEMKEITGYKYVLATINLKLKVAISR